MAEGAAQNHADTIRSARFRNERQAGWKQLESLIARAESQGVRGMSYDDALSLASLYRQAVNSLSVARAISLDKALLTYLESLCARAYLVVYAPQESIGGTLARLLTTGLPRAVRRAWVPIVIGFLGMVLGMVTAVLLYLGDPSWYYAFVPPGLADGRTPDASEAFLRRTLFDDHGRSGETLSLFASYLFSHNTQVAILTFSLGIFAILPSFVLTYYNGLVLGAFVGMFWQAGLGYEVFGWLSIHGVTELSAICIACGGGAQLGMAVLMPGNKTRRAALRARGPDALKLLILAGLMLIVAALIEGFLRQTVQSTEWRLAIGWGMGAFWVAWLGLSGRNRRRSAR